MTNARRSLVVHGHFYQPPRENPWSEEVPKERSAAPFHDWNRRIHDECYRAVVAARIMDGEGRIAAVVNTLEWINWDAGPTLLSWLAREEPATYRAFLDADARSVSRLGHGNALATPYHHVILPLASRRDKVTEVRWGIEDFRRRFGREPEGMWLPEAAVDTETLEVLAAEGILFTVLGPDQVETPPDDGSPGRVSLPSGRSIAVFVYDGGLSHDLAFGELLRDADAWVARMAPGEGRTQRLVSLATDGETFGHHHRWGDMALAAAVMAVRGRRDLRLESFASYLARNPPNTDISLVEPSAWSCAHGVERWRSDCGCRMASDPPTQQAWRSVLRDALEELARELALIFEEEASALLRDPWGARDAYGGVLDAGPAAQQAFMAERAATSLDARGVQRGLELLEMERDALRMFTSCGWFFDDIAGLEPLQVLRYAAHALDLAGDAGEALEPGFRERLRTARSNDDSKGTGEDLWYHEVVTGRLPHVTLATPSVATTKAVPLAAGADVARLEAGYADSVARFIRDPGDETARDVIVLAEELDQEGISIPFEAQTAMGRGLPGAYGKAPSATEDVAHRLGFASSALEAPVPSASGPVSYVFGLHVHQPVGNFDEVFESHVSDVYLPLLERLAERGALPVALHVSGPLLEWLEARGHRYLDLVGQLASEGSVELLLSGFYEPVLPSLPRSDRLEQIGWMHEWLHRRFGVDASGLWLTERVWEPGLAEDLHDAGVSYVLVDDRHFLVTGVERHRLHHPWRTESGGKGVSVLPIDERLRYLVPFRPPEEIATYMRGLQANGLPMAVLADDGEKFGGWPGTAEWVWEQGWLDRYLDCLDELRDDAVIRLTTPTQALDRHTTAGLAYLPTASYREMEGWSLPAPAARRLERLDALVEASGEPEAATLVRGGHWRHFLAKYSESNRMNKKAMRLSQLCRLQGDPADARQAIGRAQCNDAYWHGVFGGLYLRHLRQAIWANLAEAERILRKGQGLEAEVLDLDSDGRDEISIHSESFSAVVAPSRGGAIEELTRFDRRVNLVDVLTRRRESYHRPQAPAAVSSPDDDEGMPSIHAIEESLAFAELPPVDREDRALLVDRVLGGSVGADSYERADYNPLVSWANEGMDYDVSQASGRIVITLRCVGPKHLEKTITFDEEGSVDVTYRWDPSAQPRGARFAPELSIAEEIDMDLHPEPEAVWRHEIRTVAKSERGAEESVQGLSVTPLWPCGLGEARLSFRLS